MPPSATTKSFLPKHSTSILFHMFNARPENQSPNPISFPHCPTIMKYQIHANMKTSIIVFCKLIVP